MLCYSAVPGRQVDEHPPRPRDDCRFSALPDSRRERRDARGLANYLRDHAGEKRSTGDASTHSLYIRPSSWVRMHSSPAQGARCHLIC